MDKMKDFLPLWIMLAFVGIGMAIIVASWLSLVLAFMEILR